MTISNKVGLQAKWPPRLVAINAFGAICYLLLASNGGWVIRQECDAGINTTTGEPLIWFTSVAPVLAIFFVVNVTWGIGIIKRGHWSVVRFWLVAAGIWLVAVLIDFNHHQCCDGILLK